MAAMEAKAKATAAPATTQQAPVAQAPVQQPVPQPKPQGVDMEQVYSRKLIGELSSAGDQNPTQTMRVLLTHPLTKQEVMRQFPGTTPDAVPAVFDALDYGTRYQILMAAHKAMVKQQTPAPRPTLPPPTQTRTQAPSRVPQVAAAPGDELSRIIQLLAKQE